MHFPAVNYLAVLVAAIVIFILGGLWYSPGPVREKMGRASGEDRGADEGRGGERQHAAHVRQRLRDGLITSWVMAHLLGHFAAAVDPSVMQLNAAHGAMFGFVCWLGFAAPTSYATAIFSGKPKQLWLIDTTYNLVSFMLAGLILAVWR